MTQYDQIVPKAVPRTNSCKSTSKIIPANYTRSTTSSLDPVEPHQDRRLSRRVYRASGGGGGLSTFLQPLLSIFTSPATIVLRTCRWLRFPIQLSAAASLGRKVTGTLFGQRRGHVSFAVQDDPRSEPVFLIELAVSTSTLVKEMSSGMVRIALECENALGGGRAAAAVSLFGDPSWTMYCNGRKCGYASTRACTESEWHVLRTVQSVSVGAGVIPVLDDGGKGASAAEGGLLYMRARFERVVGSRDSEAFYMLNPDGNGGPELSIFLLRI